MMRSVLWTITLVAVLSVACTSRQQSVRAQQPFEAPVQEGIPESQSMEPWRFLVSGDSRNCGNVVMPSIAGTAAANDVEFYWHLGDFRFSSDFDEDVLAEAARRNDPDLTTPFDHETGKYVAPAAMTLLQYTLFAWPDFIQNQLRPFGDLPVYLGIGNHETIFPRTRELFLQQFADWLTQPILREQRLKDNPGPGSHMLQAYYHWVQDGVAFFSMDNSTDDMFDFAQMAWFEGALEQDVGDPSIKSIVVGMHQVLPDSIAQHHSMGQYPEGVETGRKVYGLLLDAKAAGKNVYILGSHLHVYIDGVFNTPYWRENGGVLPGWVVGTAGAFRVALPPEAVDANEAIADAYGSLLASVQPNGSIDFEFVEVNQEDVPADVVARYGTDLVNYCYTANSEN